MKEYKVIKPSLGLSKLKDILNQHAREGWELKFLHQNLMTVVFERDKNR